MTALSCFYLSSGGHFRKAMRRPLHDGTNRSNRAEREGDNFASLVSWFTPSLHFHERPTQQPRTHEGGSPLGASPPTRLDRAGSSQRSRRLHFNHISLLGLLRQGTKSEGRGVAA
jgi:hypothetical protein